jgi:hypothetical protein
MNIKTSKINNPLVLVGAVDLPTDYCGYDGLGVHLIKSRRLIELEGFQQEPRNRSKILAYKAELTGSYNRRYLNTLLFSDSTMIRFRKAV